MNAFMYFVDLDSSRIIKKTVLQMINDCTDDAERIILYRQQLDTLLITSEQKRVLFALFSKDFQENSMEKNHSIVKEELWPFQYVLQK